MVVSLLWAWAVYMLIGLLMADGQLSKSKYKKPPIFPKTQISDHSPPKSGQFSGSGNCLTLHHRYTHSTTTSIYPSYCIVV
ncbi:hypothetical protein QVD17_31887 [Tagetes erecta]|uniref:Uncharacterized protein n=1 Tax=Tagetes erecta TaxID=13708 RepID=A0AAD8K5A9_TARER|nr:hypothetical protein QVD17_31887 [Tagetes erecta]